MRYLGLPFPHKGDPLQFFGPIVFAGSMKQDGVFFAKLSTRANSVIHFILCKYFVLDDIAQLRFPI